MKQRAEHAEARLESDFSSASFAAELAKEKERKKF